MAFYAATYLVYDVAGINVLSLFDNCGFAEAPKVLELVTWDDAIGELRDRDMVQVWIDDSTMQVVATVNSNTQNLIWVDDNIKFASPVIFTNT